MSQKGANGPDQASGKGSVGSTQRKEPEQGALTRFSPPRPLHMLPYYHGRKTIAEASKLLKTNGDYLLIADSGKQNEVVLCVRSGANTIRLPIVHRPNDGKFVIEGERGHHTQAFSNMDELITYYEVYGLSIKEERNIDEQDHPRLDNPINARPDNRPPSERRRPFKPLAELQHFHGQLSAANAEKLVSIDGDYLIREDPDKRGMYWLTVRGGGAVHHFLLERNPLSGAYPLPRSQVDEPVECVTSIDEWVQFHVLFKIAAFDSFPLIRAIPKPNSNA